MKRITGKYRLSAAFLAVVLLMLFSGCRFDLTLSADDNESDVENAVSDQSTENESMSTRSAFVSIIQYIDYSSLNECCNGVKKTLDAAGIPYDVTIGSDRSAVSDCEEKARDIAINAAADLVVVIGTPCADAVCPILNSAGRIPIVFCGVTDPVGAGVVNDLKEPGVNCTGVASAFDIAEQLNMINTFQPSITKLGVIYTESERNAQSQLKTLEKEAKELRIDVYSEAISDPSELAEKAAELMKKVEAVVLLPDNVTAKNSWNVTNQSIVNQIPLYGVNISQVKEGCLAGYCFDFESMGERAGDMAKSILHGESAADMPVEVQSPLNLYVNKDRLKDLEMEIPEEYKTKAKEVATSYEK